VDVKRQRGPFGVHDDQAASRALGEIAALRAPAREPLGEPFHGSNISPLYNNRHVIRRLAARAALPYREDVLRIGSLFSGIGGLEKGLEMAGLGPVVYQVEIDPFCRAVLAKHWPDVPRFEDVRKFGKGVPTELPAADLICGGFP
jgi:C-5 cytosine-specific DNA methylase